MISLWDAADPGKAYFSIGTARGKRYFSTRMRKRYFSIGEIVTLPLG